jgi:phenylacetate-CoA ligase
VPANLRGDLYYLGAMLRGATWRRHLREIRSAEHEEVSLRYLKETIRHAVTHVPYYASLGLPPTADVSSFPILTRRLLREHYTDLQSCDRGRRGWSKTCSGGSTGEPVWVVRDRAFRHWDHAADMYYLSTLLGMPISYYLSHHRLSLWHRRGRRRSSLSPVDWAAGLLKQCTYLEPYTVTSDETLLRDIGTLNRSRPAVIWGYASSLHQLARFASQRRIPLHRPRFIISSVEMLYPAMREAITQAFGCPVYDYYGAIEVGRVAAECTRGRLHVFTFNNHVEVLDPAGRPAAPGEEGRLVITPVHNRAMPLLRYDIGDMARVSKDECSCGSSLPLLDEIRGRVIERFVTADGRTVYGGYFIAMFFEHEWISEVQVLQQDVDLITVYYRKMPGCAIPSQAVAQINDAVREVMGASCRIEWLEVDAVPRTPIGKHLHARSLVWEERQRRDA